MVLLFFFSLSTALVTAFLNLEMYLELERCLFKSDLPPHSLCHPCTKTNLTPLCWTIRFKAVLSEENSLILQKSFILKIGTLMKRFLWKDPILMYCNISKMPKFSVKKCMPLRTASHLEQKKMQQTESSKISANANRNLQCFWH